MDRPLNHMLFFKPTHNYAVTLTKYTGATFIYLSLIWKQHGLLNYTLVIQSHHIRCNWRQDWMVCFCSHVPAFVDIEHVVLFPIIIMEAISRRHSWSRSDESAPVGMVQEAFFSFQPILALPRVDLCICCPLSPSLEIGMQLPCYREVIKNSFWADVVENILLNFISEFLLCNFEDSAVCLDKCQRQTQVFTLCN